MADPKDVTLRPDGIHIAWDDAHQSYYPHRFLRGECPCASCVHEMTGRRMVSAKDVPADVEALDWIQVGRYAVQFLWSDAHETGIYTYDLLRRVCQCDACVKARR